MEKKFRAWNGKEMSRPFTLHDICRDDDSRTFIWKQKGSERFYIDNTEIMQYPGLKDKHGKKEIYEADIISNGKMTSIVYFEHGCFFVKLPIGFGSSTITNELIHFSLYEINETFEIIGNKYENPNKVPK